MGFIGRDVRFDPRDEDARFAVPESVPVPYYPRPMTLPRAILFDMDGTLIEENLFLDNLRGRLGIPAGNDVLAWLITLDPAAREQAEAILHDVEHRGAREAILLPGCSELLHWLDARGIARALITRNTRQSVRTVFDRCGLHFDVAITREDGEFKPDPAPLRDACDRLGISTADAWMVGDWKYDIEAANRAQVHGVWLSFGRERPFAAMPDRVVHDLLELHDVLKTLADV